LVHFYEKNSEEYIFKFAVFPQLKQQKKLGGSHPPKHKYPLSGVQGSARVENNWVFPNI